MKSFDKADDTFIQAATDDSTRQILIRELAGRRNLFQTIAILSTVIALGSLSVCAFGKPSLSSVGILATMYFCATMQWMQVFKCESDLRLLKLVDKLKK